MKNSIALFLFLFVDIATVHPMLPGRLGSNDIYWVGFGECKICFYMTPGKYELAKKMISHVNEDMHLTFDQTDLPCPTRSLVVQAIKNLQKDSLGTAILDQYAAKVEEILATHLGIKITGVSRYLNLNLNWEALRLHRDRFVQQYDYLKQNRLLPTEYALVQDLTLIDWEMAQGTISATLVQDGTLGDRFLITLFPEEIVCACFCEPALAFNAEVFTKNVTLPIHSVIPAMDMHGSLTCGSSKGKRMSAVVRGVTLNENIDKLCVPSRELSVNRRRPLYNEKLSWAYDNGILIKNLDNIPKLNIKNGFLRDDEENIAIIDVPIKENTDLIQKLTKLFGISYQTADQVQIKRLVKRDGGFSQFSLMNFHIPLSSTVILLNSSIFPEGYRYFNLAEDKTKQGLPWLQLYHFDPSTAMQIPTAVFNQLSMSPIEELLFRDENIDAIDSQASSLKKKLVSVLDVFIFHKKP